MKGRQLGRLEPSGLILDAAPYAVPDQYWTGARDVIFRDHPERVKGYAAALGTPLVAPHWAVFTRDAAYNPLWLYAGPAGAAVTDGTTHADITPASWGTVSGDNAFTGGVLNGVPVVCNGAGVFYWPGTGDLLPLPGWPTGQTAYALRPFKFHLIAMGIQDATNVVPELVQWSAAAAPGEVPASWTPAATNESGSFSLAATPGALIDGAALRNSFIAYKAASCYVLDYVGGAQVFTQRLLFGEAGALARNCICPIAEFHIVLTDSDVLIHDGSTVRSLVEGRIRRSMFRNVDGDTLRRSFVVANGTEGEIWVCMPEPGAAFPSVAYVWNRARDRWGIRALPEEPAGMAAGAIVLSSGGGGTGPTWDPDAAAWDVDVDPWDTGAPAELILGQLLECVPDPASLLAVDVATDRAGEVILGSLERTGIGLGKPDSIKTVKRVWLDVRGTIGDQVAVRLGATDDPNGDPVYGPAVPYTIGVSKWANCFATGRWFGVRVDGLDTGQVTEPWRLVSLSLEFEMRGLY